MAKRFSSDELHRLKKLTNEVFLISNKPQLPIVQKMKQRECFILTSGIKKVAMDYFYCKNCDKEHKFAICRQCKEYCHKGHVFTDYVKGSEEHLAWCMCGFKGHNMGKKEKEANNEQNRIKCCFNQLSLLAEIYEYYVAANGKRVCIFCYHFCCHSLLTEDDDDEESRMRQLSKYKFKRVKVTREEFEYGIQKGEIVCECLTLPESKHKSADFLSLFINDLNIPSYDEEDDDDYFSNLSPTHIINLFFSSTELFENIYTGFISEYNDWMTQWNDKTDKNIVSNTFCVGYVNFASNANNCKYNYYFNEKINIYFTSKLTKLLLDKNLKMNEQMNLFWINYIRGYIKYRLGSYFEEVPRYLMTDIINLNPLQRIIFREKARNIFISSGLSKENLLETVWNTIQRTIRFNLDWDDSLQFFIELFRWIKFYSRFFLCTNDEICKICKSIDDFFCYLNWFRTQNPEEIVLKDEKAKLLKTITKTIAYFTIYVNDTTFYSFYTNSSMEHNFFQTFTECSKHINKIMLHASDFLREDYEIVSRFIAKEEWAKKWNSNNTDNNESVEEDDENAETSNEDYKMALMRIVYINQITIDLALNETDTYLPSLRRVMSSNLPYYLKLLNQYYYNNNKFIKWINEEANTLEGLYSDYFNGSKIKIEMLQDYTMLIWNKINTLLKSPIKNIFKKNDGVISCNLPTYEYKGMKNTKKPGPTIPPNTFLLNGTNILYSITKIFRLNKRKSVYSNEVCETILELCFTYINDNPDSCVIGWTSPIWKNLTKIPRTYLCCVIDYMIFGMKVLIKYKCEVPFSFLFAKFGFLVYYKTTSNSGRNRNQDLPNSPLCLMKLFKWLQMLYEVKSNDAHQFLDYIKPKLQDLMKTELIQSYKSYLLDIVNDFKEDSEIYLRKLAYDNDEIFNDHFSEHISTTPGFDTHLMFKIFFRYLRWINKTFDVNALEVLPGFLKEFLTPTEIAKILSITTLHLSLRLEIVKYFRMIYIDLPICLDRMDQYRYQFQEELDPDVAQVGDSLIPHEQMKIFLILQRWMKVGEYNFLSEESKIEYEILFFEVKNIMKILTHSKKVDWKVYLSYFENGIMFPIKIYLNKVFSMIMTIKGEGIIKLYRFCYYVLKMKQYVIESKIISAAASDENNMGESVWKNEKLGSENTLNELKEDILKITRPNFTILNYLEIYKIITKHVMSIIENPTSVELVLYFSEYEKFEENIQNKLKKEYKEDGINFGNYLYKNAWNAYKAYINQRSISSEAR